MSAILRITRAGPLATLQDEGRFGMLRHGVSASGPMDSAAYRLAGRLAGAGRGGVEFTAAGLDFVVASGEGRVGFAGGDFTLRCNAQVQQWNGAIHLVAGDSVSVTPGAWGNYGYLRFGGDILAEPVLGSIATSSRVGLGGWNGRNLRVGDVLKIAGNGTVPEALASPPRATGPIRIIWGLHADLLGPAICSRFVSTQFRVSAQMDRMGIRLEDTEGVFADVAALSLVSDAIMPGDIQILGNGTPIVLMRDHQPTGGYPRIATVISADLDRFAQMRPGSMVAFTAVTVEHAQALLRDRSG